MFAPENNNQNVCRTPIYKRKHSQTTAGKGQAIKEFYQIRELAYHWYNRHHCHLLLCDWKDRFCIIHRID